LVEIPRFTGAYGALDTSWLPSLGTGIVLPIGAGFVFHSWWKTDEKKKGRNILLAWFGALMVLEPCILVPWGVAQLRNEPLASVVVPGFWEIAWVTIVMMSPFIMMAAVVNGLALQKGMVSKPRVEVHEVEKKGIQLSTSDDNIIQRPTTWQEFLAQYPDMLKMTNAQVVEKAGITICERTGGNWKKYATEYLGDNGNAKRITQT
jgi:hypothetical protein